MTQTEAMHAPQPTRPREMVWGRLRKGRGGSLFSAPQRADQPSRPAGGGRDDFAKRGASGTPERETVRTPTRLLHRCVISAPPHTRTPTPRGRRAKMPKLLTVDCAGNFLRGNTIAQRTIVYTMGRLPQNEYPTTALFFRHEGYFGAIGAFLQTCRTDGPAPQSENSLSERSSKSE